MTGSRVQENQMDSTDEQLMAAYRSGDAAAFDLLYARYRGPVYRYLLRHCANDAECEELFQDVWMKLIRGAFQWREGEPVRPWLFRIARNRLVDYWRRPRVVHESLDEGVVPTNRAWPDALLQIRDCIERLKHLLSRLAAAQRDAFLLKEEGGLSLAQIAEVTGVGRETVKSRLRYAVRHLRSGLEDCDDTA